VVIKSSEVFFLKIMQTFFSKAVIVKILRSNDSSNYWGKIVRTAYYYFNIENIITNSKPRYYKFKIFILFTFENKV
jgi:hypothetical protein